MATELMTLRLIEPSYSSPYARTSVSNLIEWCSQLPHRLDATEPWYIPPSYFCSVTLAVPESDLQSDSFSQQRGELYSA